MMQVNSQKYAVVDLEATGAHAMAEIIQVGIVIIENNQIVKTYQTDVNPHEALTEHIIHLTGITDEQLAKAPDFSQVAQEIYHLISDCVFVAHNVKFDANLLAEKLFLEGYELRTPLVDTVELSQVFYPTLEKYTLGHLADVLQLDLTDAHTAISDAYATAQLLLKLKEKWKVCQKNC
jgi:dinG_rel: putative DnaQ family exonuclease/DinG family helicase